MGFFLSILLLSRCMELLASRRQGARQRKIENSMYGGAMKIPKVMKRVELENQSFDQCQSSNRLPVLRQRPKQEQPLRLAPLGARLHPDFSILPIRGELLHQILIPLRQVVEGNLRASRCPRRGSYVEQEADRLMVRLMEIPMGVKVVRMISMKQAIREFGGYDMLFETFALVGS